MPKASALSEYILFVSSLAVLTTLRKESITRSWLLETDMPRVKNTTSAHIHFVVGFIRNVNIMGKTGKKEYPLSLPATYN
jgi:hypothetical protein